MLGTQTCRNDTTHKAVIKLRGKHLLWKGGISVDFLTKGKLVTLEPRQKG